MRDFDPSVKWIRHKLPIPIKIVLGFGIPVILISTWTAIFQTKQHDVAALIMLLGGGCAFLIYTNHSGYRVAWDAESVYMRNWGFRNLLFQRHLYHAIAYEEMAYMNGYAPPGSSPPLTRVIPYQSLEIASRDAAIENISIYPSGLNERDLIEFLVDLHGKRPDIFPEAVLKQIRKINGMPPLAG